MPTIHQHAVPVPEAVVTRATLRAASRLGLANKVVARVIGVSEATVSRMGTGAYVLKPADKSYDLALLFVRLFRSLDALRVFDVIYVLTAGGPGTATEPVAVYTFTTLLRNLRFGAHLCLRGARNERSREQHERAEARHPHPSHCKFADAGNTTINVVPTPTVDSTSISPLCTWIVRYTIDSPTPVPRSLVV